MFSVKKTRKAYQVPRAAVSEVDLEGLICTSGFNALHVDELHNMNYGEGHDGAGSEHYFEF